MGPLGAFWPKYNAAKKWPRGQLISLQGQVGPPEPVLAPKPNQPRNGQNTLGPKIGQEPQVATIQPMASGNHQRQPAQLQARIPLKFRGRLVLPQASRSGSYMV
ncbi:hypothetical protein O181_037644 [Austropuccinia psidii MF-1]|uniref:Uncharacterized protein n=1 Tax=Austropuccinia psidii MF-1 TaxID=1389203 RepID=A0A9Q3D6S5_9BASI|nr:hypothetical protein [Austropuccinia psidii MF-1]